MKFMMVFVVVVVILEKCAPHTADHCVSCASTEPTLGRSELVSFQPIAVQPFGTKMPLPQVTLECTQCFPFFSGSLARFIWIIRHLLLCILLSFKLLFI